MFDHPVGVTFQVDKHFFEFHHHEFPKINPAFPIHSHIYQLIFISHFGGPVFPFSDLRENQQILVRRQPQVATVCAPIATLLTSELLPSTEILGTTDTRRGLPSCIVSSRSHQMLIRPGSKLLVLPLCPLFSSPEMIRFSLGFFISHFKITNYES